jgi:phage replication-related protein YjqB (UPF0714/DUF867 family)
MADIYSNFAALAAAETAGVDYEVRLRDLGTKIVVLAPHGGKIEPGTSQIAEAIAGDDWSLYCFEGLRSGSGDLHITSEHFDEPQAVALIEAADTAVAVHGRADLGDPATVWLGGRDSAFRDAVAATLAAAGFATQSLGHPLPGRQVMNICNRGTSGGGVQLELPRTLRDQLVTDKRKLTAFADAVRTVIAAR